MKKVKIRCYVVPLESHPQTSSAIKRFRCQMNKSTDAKNFYLSATMDISGRIVKGSMP